MKALKSLLVALVAFTSIAFGLLLLLERDKEASYVDIYDEA